MLPPGSGLGVYLVRARKTIRLLRQGCTNRPFYHIVVAYTRAHQTRPVIEQIGSYDPLPNEHNEKLVALNLERFRFWIGNGADTTKPLAELLGLSGFYPILPYSYRKAWRARIKLAKLQQEEEKESENVNQIVEATKTE